LVVIATLTGDFALTVLIAVSVNLALDAFPAMSASSTAIIVFIDIHDELTMSSVASRLLINIIYTTVAAVSSGLLINIVNPTVTAVSSGFFIDIINPTMSASGLLVDIIDTTVTAGASGLFVNIVLAVSGSGSGSIASIPVVSTTVTATALWTNMSLSKQY